MAYSGLTKVKAWPKWIVGAVPAGVDVATEFITLSVVELANVEEATPDPPKDLGKAAKSAASGNVTKDTPIIWPLRVAFMAYPGYKAEEVK